MNAIKGKRGREVTVGELRTMPIGTEVIVWWAKDDDLNDIRVDNERQFLKKRGQVERGLFKGIEMIFYPIGAKEEDYPDSTEIEISDTIYKDGDKGVSFAGRGDVHFFLLPTKK